MSLEGYATAEGTARFAARFEGRVAPDHYSHLGDLRVSSIGLGTYLGPHEEAADRHYRDAVVHAVRQGLNSIDSAINYRCMRSERAIGEALRSLVGGGEIARDEVFVATKGGFIPFEGSPPADPAAFFRKTYIEPGIASPDDLAAGCHCMSPGYLQDQIERSRANLGLATLDLYYLHNPETQLEAVKRDAFRERVRAAFLALEEAVEAGSLRLYGAATWAGFLTSPAYSGYLSLDELLAIAEEVGGADHHFRAVQLPYSLAMPEAATLPNQTPRGHRGGPVTFLEAAEESGMAVMASASIMRSQLSSNLPSYLKSLFPGTRSDVQRAIQFVRSTPGVTTALIGMKQIRHVDENLEVSSLPKAPPDAIYSVFRSR